VQQTGGVQLETGLASSLACAISPRGGAVPVGFRGCGKRCRNSEEFVEIVERILEVVVEIVENVENVLRIVLLIALC
jgi:PII-like signaling protein